jgi:hypothetical protein
MSILDSLWVTKNALTGAYEAVKNEAKSLAGNLLLPKNKQSMAFPVDASQPVLNKQDTVQPQKQISDFLPNYERDKTVNDAKIAEKTKKYIDTGISQFRCQ